MTGKQGPIVQGQVDQVRDTVSHPKHDVHALKDFKHDDMGFSKDDLLYFGA